MANGITKSISPKQILGWLSIAVIVFGSYGTWVITKYKVNENSSSIKVNTQHIETNKKKITDNRTDIEKFKVSQSTMKDDIRDIKTDLREMKKTIGKPDSKIDDIYKILIDQKGKGK